VSRVLASARSAWSSSTQPASMYSACAGHRARTSSHRLRASAHAPASSRANTRRTIGSVALSTPPPARAGPPVSARQRRRRWRARRRPGARRGRRRKPTAGTVRSGRCAVLRAPGGESAIRQCTWFAASRRRGPRRALRRRRPLALQLGAVGRLRRGRALRACRGSRAAPHSGGTTLPASGAPGPRAGRAPAPQPRRRRAARCAARSLSAPRRRHRAQPLRPQAGSVVQRSPAPGAPAEPALCGARS
jgi:hypothetical protein